MNLGNESEDEQGYTVYGVSRIHKNTLSEAEKYPLYYTAIYDEAATFLSILVRKHRILNGAYYDCNSPSRSFAKNLAPGQVQGKPNPTFPKRKRQIRQF